MKKINTVRVLAGWLALAVSLSAQQYSFRAYRQADGLSNLAVTSLAEDRSGFLWVGTENGVYRFLGSSFERFGPEQGIAEATASDVVSDPSGTIWAGTRENLYRWDGQRFLPAGREPIRIASARHIAVEDARHLLIASKGRLYRLEHDEAGRMLSYSQVFSEPMVAALPELNRVGRVILVRGRSGGGTVWLACNKKLISLPENRIGSRMAPGDGAITVWDKSNGLPEERWDGVLEDRAGAVWAAGQTHVMVLPQGAKHFADRSIPGSDKEDVYGHAPIIEDREGKVIAVADDGIARWEGHSWRHFGRGNGLLFSNRITAAVFDAAGDLWLGSSGRGLLNWSGYQKWEGWSDAQLLPSPVVWSITSTRGDRILVGTGAGPAWISPRTGLAAPLSADRHWKYGEVSAIGTSSDGAYWVGTLSGVILRIDPKTGLTEKTSKLPAFISSALDLPNGHAIFATDQGLWEGKDGRSLHRIAAANALLGNSTVDASCAAPDGTAWFVGGNQILRFKNGAWTQPPLDGLPKLNDSLLALSCAADGAVWATGPQTGTWRITMSHDRLKALPLTLPAAFNSLAPLAISVDRRGWVWLGTDVGLMVWNGKMWRHLTEESGLIWNDVNQSAIMSANDGSLWVGTSGGVSHLMHPERVFDPVTLTVSLTDVRRGAVSYLGATQMTLPWAGPPLNFRISSPTTRNRSELALKFYLAGSSSEWMESPSGGAAFSKLEPGAYSFMAIASNPGLDAYSAPVKVDFRILAPWWRTNGFYALCLITLLLLLAASSRLYARHLLAEALLLEKQVSERTSQLKTRTKELEASREQLRVQATHDVLTGMLNRAAILRALEEEMGRAQRENRTVVVALIDLDHFKRINDTYGHLAGDEALRRFTDAIQTAIRPYDHVGRYGGEEFLLILTKVPREVVEQRLTSLHGAISNLKACVQGIKLRIDCSVGATVYDPSDSATSVESLLVIIDKALYAAKAAGRNRVVFCLPGSSCDPGDVDAQLRDSSSNSSLE